MILPRERRRTVRLRLGADACPGWSTLLRSTALIWADATNAHEVESSSAPVRVRLVR